MRKLLSELLNEGRDIDHKKRRSRLRSAAHAHGAFRREQLCGLSDLARELTAVVESINAELLDGGQGKSTTRDMVEVLALELQIAHAATVEGFNRAPGSGHRGISHQCDRLFDEFE